MESISKLTGRGFMETLALSRWLQPFTEETVHEIPIDSVCLKLDASVGLGKYYKDGVTRMNDSNKEAWPEPTDVDLDEIENVTELDNKMNELFDIITKPKTIH